MVTKIIRDFDNGLPNYRVVDVRKLLSSTNKTMVAVRPG